MRALGLTIFLAARVAAADDVLHPGAPVVDPPTLVALGVAVPITGDDNFNATVSLRYRKLGTTAWHDAMPLQRVHAELVTGFTVEPSFAGSVFDLAPATTYELELHVVDSDGGVDQTLMAMATTRDIPHDPTNARLVSVSSAAQLTTALDAAQAGDIIELTAGTYSGNFAINASGTAGQPIVIRGVAQDTVILDGGGCTGCNVLETYGNYVHIENLTVQNATRAIRMQTQGAHDIVIRRVHIRDVTLGIGSAPDQRDAYIADNILEGRLTWPCTYASDDTSCNAGGQHGLHANDDGINVQGDGHVVAHNRISGFGDAMKSEQDGVKSADFYGNDVLSAYDNGLELDGSLRNTRALRNRFTNTYATLSFQPIFGGPAYAIRNVIYNVEDEEFKLHARGTDPTVGAVILHTTVIRALRAIQVSSANTPYRFTIANSLFIGPDTIGDGFTVRYDVPSVSTAVSDFNGYFPDGQFEYGYSAGAGGMTYANLAAVIAGGKFDTNSLVVGSGVFTSGLVGPTTHTTAVSATVPTLGAASPALDRGMLLPNIDDNFTGAAPDLGAIESGCDVPIYGPRPVGVDETNEPLGCTTMTGNDASGGDDTPINPVAGDDGCCSARGDASGLAVLLLFRRRRRKLRA
jgi:hypothetical protein